MLLLLLLFCFDYVVVVVVVLNVMIQKLSLSDITGEENFNLTFVCLLYSSVVCDASRCYCCYI
jgi:hypothetical protein